MITYLISIIEGLLVIVPALLSVAFVTVAERKTMASMQRRLGPNMVGYYGLLQAFADALKLLLKEYVAPTQANIVLFFLGPIITLIFSLLGYLVIPFGYGLYISDYSLGILYMLAVSSLSTYGILLAGWSANSKYAFLGSLRSTAQLISYELILSSVILLVILLTGNLDLITIIESQRIVLFLLPLFPLFLVFFIGSIAETNRAPFDLAEANHFTKKYSLLILNSFFIFTTICKHAYNLMYDSINKSVALNNNPYIQEDNANYSSNCNNNKLNPYWITGFSDAESSFSIKFIKSSSYKLGWRLQPQFQIKLHARDYVVLKSIQNFFRVGSINKDRNTLVYTVKTPKELVDVIIPHFDNYPLITQKYADYLIFKKIVIMMNNKEHLNIEGFDKILSLRASLNLGLSEALKSEFPDVIPPVRSRVLSNEIPNPNWLTGFIDGEGCFIINMQSSGNKDKIWLTFQITQHIRDILLLENISKYFNCGRVSVRNTKLAGDFLVSPIVARSQTIIPFLDKYPLQSVKIKDFLDCSGVN